MGKRKLFGLLTVMLLIGAIIQHSFWAQSSSIGVLVMAAISAWCCWKAKD